MSGREVVDERMKSGWMILLTIFLKPVLMVFGFIMSLAVFHIGADFLSESLYPTMRGIVCDHITGMVTMITFMALFIAAYIMVARISFRLMTTIPDSILSRWMGGPSTAAGEDNDADSGVRVAAWVSRSTSGAGMVGRVGSSMGKMNGGKGGPTGIQSGSAKGGQSSAKAQAEHAPEDVNPKKGNT